MARAGAVARALIIVLFAASCAAPSGPYVAVSTAQGETPFRVEVADTEAARERGLMGRTELADGAGMLFVWPEDTTASFWMKDTLIPLSVAFIAADGRIMRILDMEPCPADPCPTYDPRASYRMALEVRQGSFARNGVRVGDRATLVR